jgi:hypothetical protein
VTKVGRSLDRVDNRLSHVLAEADSAWADVLGGTLADIKP